ncbi:MAG TPA: SpoIID/LytB domain-containing protein [Candidatus Saccharimonadales bacterium]|nr:SpoIID/LytB domain-containing protein [Candidatus Saccharimonadales bacterium]
MPLKKIVIVLWSLLLAFSLFFIFRPTIIQADQLDDINKQLSDLNTQLNQSIAATKPVESELKSMQAKIAGIKNQVIAIEADTIVKQKEIDDGYKSLAAKEKLISATIRDFYIKSYNDSPLLTLLSLNNASDATQALAFQHAKTEQDKAIITNIALSITGLEKKKADLVIEKQQLTIAKASLDDQAAKLDKIVAGAKDFQNNISSQIAQLSARQQELVAAKIASIAVPLSAETSLSGCSSDIGKSAGFSPQIGFFSYGVPHGNGLNQYGAFGRAKDGQNEEQILQTYYPSMSLKKDYDQGVQIHTDTGWSGSIEDYVKRIYEVPNSWGDQGGMAALKAQAVAARTYALRSTSNGANSICTTESCQVFHNDPKGGNWEAAVNATAGWVMMDGGNPGFTQFASTHGGYIHNLNKFDGTGGNPSNFSDLKTNAYDGPNHANSPWFYCDWGYRSQYNNTAWLKSEEVADIANSILLARADSSAAPNLYQPDKGGWDAEKVKSELRKHRSAFNNISSVSIGADFGSGITSSVTVSGDAGSETFNGTEWKDWFNSRAPANIQIKSRLYNVEQQ